MHPLFRPPGLPLLTEQDYEWLNTNSAFARLRLKYATSPALAGPPPQLLSCLNEKDFTQRGWGFVSGAGALSDADGRALQHKSSSGSGPAAAGDEVLEVDDDIRFRILRCEIPEVLFVQLPAHFLLRHFKLTVCIVTQIWCDVESNDS